MPAIIDIAAPRFLFIIIGMSIQRRVAKIRALVVAIAVVIDVRIREMIRAHNRLHIMTMITTVVTTVLLRTWITIQAQQMM